MPEASFSCIDCLFYAERSSRHKLQASGLNMHRITLFAAESRSASGAGVPAGMMPLSVSHTQVCIWVGMHDHATKEQTAAYGDKFPQTEHHFLAEAVLDGPIAAVRYVGTSGGN